MPKRRNKKTGTVRRSGDRAVADPASQGAAGPESQPEERRALSRRRAILFRLIVVSFPLLVLGLVNLGLYLFGYGFDTRVIVPVHKAEDGQYYAFNEDCSRAYFDDRELAGPDVQPFRIPRPQHSLRVVVLGASTVEGYPYYTELAFPRQVEVYLSAQLPDTKVEVLNAGIVGINSFALVDLLPRVLPCQPDIIVIYAGHNEFYGPGGVGSNATTLSPKLYSVLTQLRRWRLGQLIRNWAAGGPQPSSELVQALPRDLAIAPESPLLQLAEDYYRQHLTQMVQRCARAGVPVVLCSVASNLSDHCPVSSVPGQGVDPQQTKQQQLLLAQARTQLDEDQPESALELVEQAAKLDPLYALVAYRRGQCYAALGRKDEAAEQYRLARDQDGCRFRAPSSFRAVVKQVVEEAKAGCYYVDVDAVFAELTEKAAPGFDFFFEHVHFNRDGHREVARAIARTICEKIQRTAWDPQRAPSDEQMIQAIGLTTFDQLAALGYAARLTLNAPFSAAPDAARQGDYLTRQVNINLGQLTPEDQEIFARLSAELRALDLINAIAAEKFQRGEYPEALQLFACAQNRRPWETTGYLGVAKCLLVTGQDQAARACLQQARRVAPDDEELQQIIQDLDQRLALSGESD